MEMIQREFIYLWYYFDLQFRQIFIYWAVGVFTGSAVSVFLKKPLAQMMGSLTVRKLGIWGILPASAIGILSPLCMYGTVPIVAALSRNGMSDDWLAAFMVSSILLNPQLFFYSFALGTELAFLRLAVAFLGGCIAGLLVRLCFKNKPLYALDAFTMSESRDTAPNPFLRLFKNIGRNVKITLPYFVAGVALTAIYQRYVPSQWITGLFGQNQGLGTLMAAALGVPLYACGGGTIPLIATWLDEGMSFGSAIAFMIAGAATKLTNLGAVKIILGLRNFVRYLLFVICFASISGLLVNNLFN